MAQEILQQEKFLGRQIDERVMTADNFGRKVYGQIGELEHFLTTGVGYQVCPPEAGRHAGTQLAQVEGLH